MIGITLLITLLVLPLAAGSEPRGVALEVATPPEGEIITSAAPLVLVSGRAGQLLQHDVVLAIDVSGSAFFPSGEDLDGDGTIGEFAAGPDRIHRDAHYNDWTTDSHDTVAQAELIASRRLLDQLEARNTRVGLVLFAGSVRTRARVGPVEDTRRELEQLQLRMANSTDLANVIDRGTRLLQRAAPPEPGVDPTHGHDRLRSLILLTDGQHSPAGVLLDRVRTEPVLEAADRAAAANVRIDAFGIGPLAAKQPELMREIARRTSGRVWLVENPAAITDELPMIDLVGLRDVQIVNESSGRPARAIRVFPDGSFDGYAQLVPGKNRLRITAYLDGDRTLTGSRRVEYRPPGTPTKTDRAEANALLDKLRARTIETDLARRAQEERRKARLRELSIQIEDTK